MDYFVARTRIGQFLPRLKSSRRKPGKTFRSDFALRRKIEYVRGFVIINPVYPIAIIKHNNSLLVKIHQYAAEPAIESLNEPKPHLFITTNQIWLASSDANP